MRSAFLPLAALALGAASVSWLAASQPSQEGKKVDYTFQKHPVNSLGIRSMSELRGKPVLVDFWGKN